MTSYFNSAVGWLEIKASENALLSIRFLDTKPDSRQNPKNSITEETINQLNEYFNEGRKQFTIEMEPKGSDFQKSVWRILQDIPYGTTASYIELAKKLGDANKVRAVGRANGQNPIPIIIPCHRVIGSDNNLVGYGGGIARKQFLLKHEGAILL